MATLTALCCDEATVVLCSRLRKLGFEVSWLYMDELRHGRIEPEALADSDPPDAILYDLDEPVDESLLLLTLFRSLPGMGAVPVVLLRTAQMPLPPLDAPGIAAVLTRPCEAALARTSVGVPSVRSSSARVRPNSARGASMNSSTRAMSVAPAAAAAPETTSRSRVTAAARMRRV